LYLFIALCFKQSGDGFHLTGVRFEKEPAAGKQMIRRFCDNSPDNTKAVPAAIQGKQGFSLYLRGQSFDFIGVNVRRITYD
jgi:hypothetical protein